jgi:phenylpropionate dioxygenase-like ring-hydroxylating dioxygenase large terminal subunit
MSLDPAATSTALSGYGPAIGDADLARLIGAQPRGHSLLQAFYASEAIYRRDMEKVVLAHWHCAGHESQIPEPGDYFLFDIDRESVIVIRGKDGVVHALANVCRHRGSRICSGPSGKAKAGILTCPYHAWVYRTDGSLRNARMMPPEFDKDSHGLIPMALTAIEGLLFVSLAKKPLGMSAVGKMLTDTVAPYGWAGAKAIHHECYTINANWKLALENQVECYHCAPSHPEFVRVHSQGRESLEELRTAMMARTRAQGIDIPVCDHWALSALPGEEADYCNRYGMWAESVTASDDGKPVAPIMGRFSDYDRGFTVFYVGPFNHFLAYGDYGAIFRYTPRSVTETELHVTWLVRGDAREGADYDLDRVTWLWRVTAQADKRIVEENQIGVNSRFYEPGPYAQPIESGTQRFTEWYLKELTGR